MPHLTAAHESFDRHVSHLRLLHQWSIIPSPSHGFIALPALDGALHPWLVNTCARYREANLSPACQEAFTVSTLLFLVTTKNTLDPFFPTEKHTLGKPTVNPLWFNTPESAVLLGID